MTAMQKTNIVRTIRTVWYLEILLYSRHTRIIDAQEQKRGCERDVESNQAKCEILKATGVF